MTIQTVTLPSVPIDPAVVCRYLGARAEALPLQLLEQTAAICAEAETLGRWRACWLELPVTVEEDVVIAGSLLRLPGRALARHLKGCDRAVLLCATAGPGFDRQLAFHKLRPAALSIWDAAGTAGIESFCDLLCQRFGDGQRSRFSPGYGDLPMSCQAELLRVLDAGARLGVGLTEGLLMTPAKSVTAIVGLEANHD